MWTLASVTWHQTTAAPFQSLFILWFYLILELTCQFKMTDLHEYDRLRIYYMHENKSDFTCYTSLEVLSFEWWNSVRCFFSLILLLHSRPAFLPLLFLRIYSFCCCFYFNFALLFFYNQHLLFTHCYAITILCLVVVLLYCDREHKQFFLSFLLAFRSLRI